MNNRDETMARTFVELADTLVKDFDLVDFLSMLAERCLELLGASEVGVILVDPDGQLRVMASSSERMKALELFELQASEGPCRDAFESGTQTVNASLENPTAWPTFSAEARKGGFKLVHAFPMRLRNECLGAVNVFQTHDQPLSPSTAAIAQALADAATIGILQERLVRHNSELAEQLQVALNSRIVVEQAKGVLSERMTVSTDEAFRILRQYARSRNLRLVEVAQRIADGDLRELSD